MKFVLIVLALLFTAFYFGMFDSTNSIVYKGASVVSNDGIGSEWSFIVNINGEQVKKNKTVRDSDGKFFVSVKAIEHDKYSDVGTKSETYDTDDSGRKVISVLVRETKGPGAGKSATVEFEFVIR